MRTGFDRSGMRAWLPLALLSFSATVRADSPPRYSVEVIRMPGAWVRASDINNLGQVVGLISLDAATNRGFIYSNGVLSLIPTFGGNYSEATAINDSGEVVGNATYANLDYHAFLYSAGVLSDLGTLDAQESFA